MTPARQRVLTHRKRKHDIAAKRPKPPALEPFIEYERRKWQGRHNSHAAEVAMLAMLGNKRP